jgi:hypothetical protein
LFLGSVLRGVRKVRSARKIGHAGEKSVEHSGYRSVRKDVPAGIIRHPLALVVIIKQE